VALEYAPVAVASTLIGMQPVALLLVTGIYERRCPSPGSIIGACAACAGTAILLLR
jgi:drug/metabolite transporter (DMT)-like permease